MYVCVWIPLYSLRFGNESVVVVCICVSLVLFFVPTPIIIPLPPSFLLVVVVAIPSLAECTYDPQSSSSSSWSSSLRPRRRSHTPHHHGGGAASPHGVALDLFKVKADGNEDVAGNHERTLEPVALGVGQAYGDRKDRQDVQDNLKVWKVERHVLVEYPTDNDQERNDE